MRAIYAQMSCHQCHYRTCLAGPTCPSGRSLAPLVDEPRICITSPLISESTGPYRSNLWTSASAKRLTARGKLSRALSLYELHYRSSQQFLLQEWFDRQVGRWRSTGAPSKQFPRYGTQLGHENIARKTNWIARRSQSASSMRTHCEWISASSYGVPTCKYRGTGRAL
ncbi:hypothetical protein Q31a_08020 [Aureliella helgolandensis]|uniref:Uncharacterized protein n=1 Tax=Aureliella helgolandensis TaxID=2527968 RepID=A0A518G1Q5_9BACT|nr:hypothetical protein Q31a_08020 [Aureliella helgolandensis]